MHELNPCSPVCALCTTHTRTHTKHFVQCSNYNDFLHALRCSYSCVCEGLIWLQTLGRDMQRVQTRYLCASVFISFVEMLPIFLVDFGIICAAISFCRHKQVLRIFVLYSHVSGYNGAGYGLKHRGDDSIHLSNEMLNDPYMSVISMLMMPDAQVRCVCGC